jgi:hypothetical protein
MRKAVFCVAGLALAFVLADHVVVHGGGAAAQAPNVTVNRALKGDRGDPAPLAPAVTVVPKRHDAQDPLARRLPEGCEAAVSPLAKSAEQVRPARCLADAGAAGPAARASAA